MIRADRSASHRITSTASAVPSRVHLLSRCRVENCWSLIGTVPVSRRVAPKRPAMSVRAAAWLIAAVAAWPGCSEWVSSTGSI